jgi:hypothetical protein
MRGQKRHCSLGLIRSGFVDRRITMSKQKRQFAKKKARETQSHERVLKKRVKIREEAKLKAELEKLKLEQMLLENSEQISTAIEINNGSITE